MVQEAHLEAQEKQATFYNSERNFYDFENICTYNEHGPGPEYKTFAS